MYADLPPEILCQIFMKLGLADRLSAGLVCKNWYRSAADGNVYKDTTVVLAYDVSHRMEILKKSLRTVPDLRVAGSIPFKGDIEFWKLIGPKLNKLEFNFCDICESELVTVLQNCSNLEHLAITFCSVFLSGTLPEIDKNKSRLSTALACVKTLNLSGNRSLSDAAFRQMVSIVGSLDTLELSKCSVSFQKVVERRFYARDTTPSPLVLTFQSIIRTLRANKVRLKAIRLSRTDVDNTSLKELVTAYSQTLSKLDISNCAQLGFQGILSICQKVPGLTCLNLDQNMEMGDHCLAAICSNLPMLQELRLSRWTKLTDGAARQLAHLRKLRCLDLSFCPNVSPDALVQALCSDSRPTMRELNLSCCRVSDSLMTALADTMAHLTALDVSSSGLTDEGARAIHRLRRLRVLNMSSCDKITDGALCELAPAQADVCSSLAHLTQLKELKLAGCVQLTDRGILNAIAFRELQCLDLKMCHNLTDLGMEHIALSNPSLQELTLHGCTQLTDKSVALALHQLSRLDSLVLNGCTGLTDKILEHVAQCHTLKRIDISNCIRTEQAVDQLASQRDDLNIFCRFFQLH
ncbi:dynein regulatory complex subunit 6 [Ixodes scapularis]|uniref:dynein regulatory complex subunit 6 n=1 Tax=Ixodes scapularis TaxID=6945 RepID=UPI001A9D495B|nr:dynein regulatory complex subunit 6 [Ixodes scapularis]